MIEIPLQVVVFNNVFNIAYHAFIIYHVFAAKLAVIKKLVAYDEAPASSFQIPRKYRQSVVYLFGSPQDYRTEKIYLS